MARKSSTKPGESSYVRRLRRRAERIGLATAVYDADFRNAVAKAWELYRDGEPIVKRRCGLLALLKEADEIFAQGNVAGRRIRDAARGAGLPVGEPDDDLPGGRYYSPLVRFKGAPQLGTFKLISKPKDGKDEVEASACLLTQQPLPLSLLEFQNCNFCGVLRGLIHSDSCPFIGGGVMGHQCGPGVKNPRGLEAAALPQSLCRVCSEPVCSAHLGSCLFDGNVTVACTDEVDMVHRPWERPEAAYLPNPALYNYCVGCTCETCGQEGCTHCPIHKGSCWNKPQESPDLVDLRARLARLERLPENEAIAFQLESEIYKIENASGPDEWPDVIGGA